MPLLKMRLFFTFIACTVLTAGAVSDNGIVKVKKGENFSLFVKTPEMKFVRRLTVRRNGTQEVFRYCSGEEQSLGCEPNNTERFSLQIGNETVNVTFLDANTSDEGVYDVEVIDDNNKRIHDKFTVALTGAVSDNGIVKVKKGENFSLFVKTPEMKFVRRLTVRRNGTQEVFRYCSGEEQSLGCEPNNTERFSLQIGNETVNVTFLDANTSDEGVYDVEVIDDNNKRIHDKFTVALTGALLKFLSPPTPPPQRDTSVHPPDSENGSLKTPCTISLELINIIAGVFAVIAIVILLWIIYCKCEKMYHDIRDPEDLNSTTSGETSNPDTDESLKMVDETECFVDNNNHLEEGRNDLNHEDRKRMTDKTGVQEIVWTHKTTTRTDAAI